MLKSAKLDWNVEKKGVYYESDGKYVQADNQNILVRTDNNKVLGPAGPGYIPFQNSEVIDFYTKFVESGHMTMETMGSLDEGRHVFALAKLKEYFVINKDDKTEAYLLISHPHVWGKADKFLFTPIRVVCSNTIQMALSANGNQYRVPHIQPFTNDIKLKVEEALGICAQQLNSLKVRAEHLSSVQYKEADLQEYVAKLFQPDLVKEKNKLGNFKPTAEDAYTAIQRQPRLKASHGTWWEAFNGMTYYIDHEAGRDRGRALENAWFGARANTKRQALSLALEYSDK
jgi:phage/plasmid-like protein (TIGR03299 family)